MLGGGGMIAVLVAVLLVSGFFQSVRVFYVKAGAEKQVTTICFTLRNFPLFQWLPLGANDVASPGTTSGMGAMGRKDRQHAGGES